MLAARTAGVRTPTILVRHIVPHVLPSVLVYCALGVATAIQLEAALSYVGIGIQPPTASWGNMIADGQAYLIDGALAGRSSRALRSCSRWSGSACSATGCATRSTRRSSAASASLPAACR